MRVARWNVQPSASGSPPERQKRRSEARLRGRCVMPDGFDADAAIGDLVLRKLRLDIGALDRASDPAAITKIIDRLARSSLDAVQIDRLLQTIKTQTGTPLRALRQQLAVAQLRSKSFDDGTLAPRIEALNQEYFVLNEGGKAWVARYRYDPALGRDMFE